MSFVHNNRCPETHWKRAIILMDMNAFFASVEQHDHPEWQGRPLVITNGEQGTCIITCSYEARMYGIKTGMRVKDARRLCPGFIQVPAHPQRYAEVSSRIMTALESITPDIEIFSVDEAFLDVTHVQKLWGSPETIAHKVKRTVLETSDICCSIGVSGDKTTAKYAAKLNKPNGLTIIPPWQAREVLANVPVTELCGIARGISEFLAQRGVFRCGDMARLPISVLARRFGNPGRRIWYMCQGEDPDDLHTEVAAPKSIGHGKVMPPNTRDKAVLKTYLLHMSEKVAARLRKHHLQARAFFVGLLTADNWLGYKFHHAIPTDDATVIMQFGHALLDNHWQGEGVFQVQVTALDPSETGNQQELFDQSSQHHSRLNQARDKINQRFGEFAIAPGRLLKRSRMPNVIAPAWKPHGHRETILG